MQLRKMVMMLVAVGAASMVLTGCPGGGGGSTTCATSTDCLTSEVCHPDAKVCVQTCTAAADCPDTAKKCEALGGTTADKDKMICKCTTDALCNSGRQTADQYCAAATGLCTKKCTADADCGTNGTCETATGVCKPKDTVGTSCTGEGQSTCMYGQFCSASKCAAVPAPTCDNFNPSKGGKQPTFNPATSKGPIIFSITKSSWAPDTASTPFCGTADTAKIQVKAYQSGTNTFPAQKSALSGLFYVRVSGDATDGTALIRSSEYSVSTDGKIATFTMNFCPGNLTALSIGLYFTDGNEICAQIAK